MSERSDLPPRSPEPYSPQRRTALVLSGTGTAGAYHAGVLRALHEAGVKLDVVAGRGVGVIGALFAAIDGAQRLWDVNGVWKSTDVRRLYRWTLRTRVALRAMAVSVAVVALPVGVIALGLVVFPVDFVLKMVGLGGASGLAGLFLRGAERAFAPGALPTWLPRLVVLVLGGAGLFAAMSVTFGKGRGDRGRRWRGAFGAPLSSREASAHCWRSLWDLLKGAATLRAPDPRELGRRYSEVLTDNLGQPGFRELLIVAHDVDAHRDLVFALVSEHRRRDLVRRVTAEAADARKAELFDLAGSGRDALADAVGGALTVPMVSEPHAMTFSPDAYWRGETHRLCDRPSSLRRLVDELVGIGVEQIILVSASSPGSGPHTLGAPRPDGRGRIGEYLQSAEAAIVRDVVSAFEGRQPVIFGIHPSHNPIGPFEFERGFDNLSDRQQPFEELMHRGYEDAYRQFIEPVVGASGEQVGRAG